MYKEFSQDVATCRQAFPSIICYTGGDRGYIMQTLQFKNICCFINLPQLLVQIAVHSKVSPVWPSAQKS